MPKSIDTIKLNRLSDAVLLNDGVVTDKENELNLPMVNTLYGGQWGFSPVFGRAENGVLKSEFVSSQPYVPRDVDVALIQYPKFMDLLPNPESHIGVLKAFLEKHAETIDGLDNEVTVESEAVNLGPSGSAVMGVPTGSRIAKSTPVFTVTEKVGRPFGRMLETYIKFGIIDPWTQVALIGAISKEARDMFKSTAYLADFYTFTALYYETDITMSHIVDCWLHLGGYPTSGGERKGASNKGQAKAVRKLSITMEGFTITTDSVFKYAQELLDKRGVRNTTPINVLPFSAKDSAVTDADNPYGFNGNAGVDGLGG